MALKLFTIKENTRGLKMVAEFGVTMLLNCVSIEIGRKGVPVGVGV
jgi:hypothetical protein